MSQIIAESPELDARDLGEAIDKVLRDLQDVLPRMAEGVIEQLKSAATNQLRTVGPDQLAGTGLVRPQALIDAVAKLDRDAIRHSYNKLVSAVDQTSVTLVAVR